MLLLLGVAAGWLVNLLADRLPPEPRPNRLRSWLVLCAAAGIGLALGLFPVSMNPFLALGILTYFGVVAVIDMEHRLILHSVSLSGALLAAISGVFLHGWWQTLIGGLAGFGAMFFFYWVGTLFAKYRARRRGADDGEEALGFGDVTISGVLGLLLGWPDVMLMLLVGVLLGGMVSLLIVAGQALFRRYQPMETFTAYGPYLLIGASALLFFRDAVLQFFFH
ncbi:MAG: hypothetical protein OHK0031_13320 [Anaerolineales bacterium]